MNTISAFHPPSLSVCYVVKTAIINIPAPRYGGKRVIAFDNMGPIVESKGLSGGLNNCVGKLQENVQIQIPGIWYYAFWWKVLG